MVKQTAPGRQRRQSFVKWPNRTECASGFGSPEACLEYRRRENTDCRRIWWNRCDCRWRKWNAKSGKQFGHPTTRCSFQCGPVRLCRCRDDGYDPQPRTHDRKPSIGLIPTNRQRKVRLTTPIADHPVIRKSSAQVPDEKFDTTSKRSNTEPE